MALEHQDRAIQNPTGGRDSLPDGETEAQRKRWLWPKTQLASGKARCQDSQTKVLPREFLPPWIIRSSLRFTGSLWLLIGSQNWTLSCV